MTSNFDLVLFDLDGTLVDTAPDIADAVNTVLTARNLPSVTQPWVRDRIGQGSRVLLLHAYALASDISEVEARQHGIEQSLIEEFASAYARLCGRRGRVYAGAPGMLATLRSHGVKLALITNKEQRFARLVLEIHGLDSEFDLRVYGDSLPACKPDALPVRHCLNVLGVPAARALLVGDSEIDVRTARNAGVTVWAVNYGYSRGQPISHSEPDRVISRLSVISEAFEEYRHGVAYPPRASSSSLYLRNSPRN